MICYVEFRELKMDKWLLLSNIFAGIALASLIVMVVAGFLIDLDFVERKKLRRQIGITIFATFVALAIFLTSSLIFAGLDGNLPNIPIVRLH